MWTADGTGWVGSGLDLDFRWLKTIVWMAWGWACCDLEDVMEMCPFWFFLVISMDWGPRCFHTFFSGYRSEEFASFLKLVVGPRLKKMTIDKVKILYIGFSFASSKTSFSAVYLKIPDIWSRVHTALGLLHPDWKEEIQDTKGTGRKDIQED